MVYCFIKQVKIVCKVLLFFGIDRICFRVFFTQLLLLFPLPEAIFFVDRYRYLGALCKFYLLLYETIKSAVVTETAWSYLQQKRNEPG